MTRENAAQAILAPILAGPQRTLLIAAHYTIKNAPQNYVSCRLHLLSLVTESIKYLLVTGEKGFFLRLAQHLARLLSIRPMAAFCQGHMRNQVKIYQIGDARDIVGHTLVTNNMIRAFRAKQIRKIRRRQAQAFVQKNRQRGI